MISLGNHSRHARIGILLIIIGLLWFAKRAGLFPPEILGPLVLLAIGAWFVVVSWFRERQKTSIERRQ